jgi:hypothetical protein
MKPSIRRIVILPEAIGAHPEWFHRGLRAVIRYIFYYSKAGSAVRAVGKRVPIAPIVMIENLRETIRASGYIGGYKGKTFLRRYALLDRKGIIPERRELSKGNSLYDRQRRSFVNKLFGEIFKGTIIPLYLYQDTFRSIQDKP